MPFAFAIPRARASLNRLGSYIFQESFYDVFDNLNYFQSWSGSRPTSKPCYCHVHWSIPTRRVPLHVCTPPTNRARESWLRSAVLGQRSEYSIDQIGVT